MAMQLVASLLGARLPVLVRHSMMPLAGATVLALSGQRQLHNHTGRLTNPWEEVLRVAKSSPEKLHEIINTLTNHCIKAQAAPPLDTYNELLRICEMHSDLASVHKLCQMACAVRMHLDHTTFDRLQSVYSYFPKPYPSTAAKGSFAGKDGLGPSTTQHSATGSSSSSGATAAAASSSTSSSSSRGTVRTGAILEAPPASSMPSVSATGGASSVSISSVRGTASSPGSRPGGVKVATTQTNVWAASTGVISTQLEALRREREQQQQHVNGPSGASSDTATSVNAPDAAA